MEGITNIVVLGSTGSIGEQALQVVDLHPDKFRIAGLAAKDEVPDLYRQINKYHPGVVAVSTDKAYRELKQLTQNQVEILVGIDGLCELAALDSADTVIVSVSGAIGIRPTLAAIDKGKRIALANKETLVAAGDMVMDAAQKAQAMIIPVDSEHSAIFQCLQGQEKYLQTIWLTASGGPFREFNLNDLEKVTIDMALRHPNWKMGPKITIDSATMMNKGLEVIEAHHLFNADYDNIKVLIQKESAIHSMVELVDGSFIAHMGTADMRIPIQYALTYPERLESPAKHLDFSRLGVIHCEKPDCIKFPALKIAYEAGKIGGTMPAVMNAANEVAVNSFLHGKIKFTRIISLVKEVMEKHTVIHQPDLDSIFLADQWAREVSANLLAKGVE